MRGICSALTGSSLISCLCVVLMVSSPHPMWKRPLLTIQHLCSTFRFPVKLAGSFSQLQGCSSTLSLLVVQGQTAVSLCIITPSAWISVVLFPSLELHSHFMLCWKQACIKVLQLRQQSTASIQKNDPKYAELDWRCIPLAVENYGAWGPESLRVFLQVASQLAFRGNIPPPPPPPQVQGSR